MNLFNTLFGGNQGQQQTQATNGQPAQQGVQQTQTQAHLNSRIGLPLPWAHNLRGGVL